VIHVNGAFTCPLCGGILWKYRGLLVEDDVTWERWQCYACGLEQLRHHWPEPEQNYSEKMCQICHVVPERKVKYPMLDDTNFCETCQRTFSAEYLAENSKRYEDKHK